MSRHPVPRRAARKAVRNAAGIAMSLALLACAGCASIDPYQRVGVWRPRNSNEGNLAAMIADPHDLQVGRSASGADALLAAAAVDRLRHDKVKALPTGSFDTAPASSSTSGGGSAGDGIN